MQIIQNEARNASEMGNKPNSNQVEEWTGVQSWELKVLLSKFQKYLSLFLSLKNKYTERIIKQIIETNIFITKRAP